MALAWLHTIRDDRTQRFAAARNAEIDASIAAVKAARERDFALSLTHCKTAGSETPRCEAERAREFAAARNAEAAASLAAVQAARDRNFAQARNAEITASIATVETARARTAALSTTHCTGMGEPSPRCEAERARELAMSMTHCKPGASESPRCEVERTREFAAARNAEINASIALSNAAHDRLFAEARNAEINASIALANAARDRLFAEARNAEINASIAAVETERAIRSARAQRQSPSIETGAIRVPEVPVEPVLPLRRSINAEPCAAAGIRLTPVQFSGPGATVDEAMKPGLDTIAAIAKDCPAVHIEIHGYSDSLSAVQVSRLLSEMRAKAVMAYLESAGVDAGRMVAIGHGDMMPARRQHDGGEPGPEPPRRVHHQGPDAAGGREARDVGPVRAARPHLRAAARAPQPLSQRPVARALAQGGARGAENGAGFRHRALLQQHGYAVVVLECVGGHRLRHRCPRPSA